MAPIRVQASMFSCVRQIYWCRDRVWKGVDILPEIMFAVEMQCVELLYLLALMFVRGGTVSVVARK